jgi:hypothetical protein
VSGRNPVPGIARDTPRRVPSEANFAGVNARAMAGSERHPVTGSERGRLGPVEV